MTSRSRIVWLIPTFGLLGGIAGVNTYTQVKNEGPQRFVRNVCSTAWLKSNEKSTGTLLASRDKTIQTCIGALEIHSFGHGDEDSSNSSKTCTLLFGPQGAGRDIVLDTIRSTNQPLQPLLVDVEALDQNKVRRFTWPGTQWALYSLYYALQSYFSWPEMLETSLASASDDGDVWVLDRIGTCTGKCTRASVEAEKRIVRTAVENEGLRLVLNSSTQTLDEFKSRYNLSKREIAAIRLGDPTSQEAKDSRLHSALDALRVSLSKHVGDQTHDLSKTLEYSLEKVIGWRFDDVVCLVDKATQTAAASAITASEGAGEMDTLIDGAANAMIEEEKKFITDRLVHDKTMDDQISVWLWKMLETLCGIAVSVSFDHEGSSSTKGMKVAVLPALEYIGDGIDQNPGDTSIRCLSRGLLEVVQGPPHLVATRRVLSEAFRQLAFDHQSEDVKTFDRKMSTVHELQDMHRLGLDIQAYFARFTRFEDRLEDLQELIAKGDEADEKRITVLQVDLDSENNHLQIFRRDLLRRYRELFPPADIQN